MLDRKKGRDIEITFYFELRSFISGPTDQLKVSGHRNQLCFDQTSSSGRGIRDSNPNPEEHCNPFFSPDAYHCINNRKQAWSLQNIPCVVLFLQIQALISNFFAVQKYYYSIQKNIIQFVQNHYHSLFNNQIQKPNPHLFVHLGSAMFHLSFQVDGCCRQAAAPFNSSRGYIMASYVNPTQCTFTFQEPHPTILGSSLSCCSISSKSTHALTGTLQSKPEQLD